ncbi:MAG: cobalamin biosynthesis protein [Candidatus Methanomethylophilus sp.]|nr:cobalamin biosynthesis protein [Methanomethylophilus sp.]
MAARVLDGRPVGFLSDFPVIGTVPPELDGGAEAPVGVYVGERTADPFPETLRLTPRRLVLGIGCRRGTPIEAISALADQVLAEHGYSCAGVRAVASIDLKKDEAGLLAYAARLKVPALFYSTAELNAVPVPAGGFSQSRFVTSVTGVDCVCERAAVKAARAGALVIKKTALNGVTVAVCAEDFTVDFRGVQ